MGNVEGGTGIRLRQGYGGQDEEWVKGNGVRCESVAVRLRRLERLFTKGLISESEHFAMRQRILDEM